MKHRGRYEGVVAYVGMPGSGKTYALAEVAKKAMAEGRPVFCNAGFDVVGAETFSSFEEFCELPNGSTVVWDELPLYVNARKWSEFPDGLLYRLTQIRKDGLRLYYSAIHESMIDANVRRVTFWYWHCRAITGRILRRAMYPPEEFRKATSRPMRRQLVRVRPAVWTLYDTFGKVAVVEVKRGSRDGVLWTKPRMGLHGDGPVPAGQVRPTTQMGMPSVRYDGSGGVRLGEDKPLSAVLAEIQAEGPDGSEEWISRYRGSYSTASETGPSGDPSGDVVHADADSPRRPAPRGRNGEKLPVHSDRGSVDRGV